MVKSEATQKIVAIGVFDGVHGGHRSLIKQALDFAHQDCGQLTVSSFDPHPTSVLRPDDFLGLLTTPNRRRELLLDLGVNRVEFLAFDDQLRNMSPEEFVEIILLEQLKANAVVVGSNFRFGYKAQGDVATLQQLGNKFGIKVHVITLMGDGFPLSSTRIRKEIGQGNVLAAAQLLGRPHRLTGRVVHGDHRGRELGYPTANLQIESQLIVPVDGVYSAILSFQNGSYPAAVSIGNNPTFDGVIGRRVEAYVLDRDDLDLYDQVVDLDFVDHVRPMRKFEGIDQLLGAMGLDVASTREHIARFQGMT